MLLKCGMIVMIVTDHAVLSPLDHALLSMVLLPSLSSSSLLNHQIQAQFFLICILCCSPASCIYTLLCASSALSPSLSLTHA